MCWFCLALLRIDTIFQAKFIWIRISQKFFCPERLWLIFEQISWKSYRNKNLFQNKQNYFHMQKKNLKWLHITLDSGFPFLYFIIPWHVDATLLKVNSFPKDYLGVQCMIIWSYIDIKLNKKMLAIFFHFKCMTNIRGITGTSSVVRQDVIMTLSLTPAHATS